MSSSNDWVGKEKLPINGTAFFAPERVFNKRVKLKRRKGVVPQALRRK